MGMREGKGKVREGVGWLGNIGELRKCWEILGKTIGGLERWKPGKGKVGKRRRG